MLKVITGNARGSALPAFGGGRCQGHTYELPTTPITPEDMLLQALRSKGVDDACSSIVETYEAGRSFANKLAAFFTTAFPSSSPSYESALCEILDAATVGYLRTEAVREPKEQLATFLATGVLSATTVLMCYSTFQLKSGDLVQWDPWEDGALSDWAQWGGKELQFEAALAPTPERRYATRSMLQQRLLRFKDTMAIARAGIDLQSFDMF